MEEGGGGKLRGAMENQETKISVIVECEPPRRNSPDLDNLGRVA